MDQRYIGRGPASPPSAPLWRRTGLVAAAAIVLGALLVAWLTAFNTQAGTVEVAREAANAQEQELRKQNFKAQETFNTAKAQADAAKALADAEAYAIAIKGKAQLDIQERQAAILKANPLLIDWERAQRLAPGVLPHTFVGGDGTAALMFQLGASQPSVKK
jgi:regulator of protease activity HflC (stomatin/prohibitin superfamily)